MGERARVVRRGGRLWTVRRVPRAEAVEADFRFWYEGLTAEERVEAVEAALESCLKTRGADGVRYLVVGAHAVAFHARPRATKDLDVFVEPTRENAQRLLAALRTFFGSVELGYTAKDVIDPRWIIQLGVAPARIDLGMCAAHVGARRP